MVYLRKTPECIVSWHFDDYTVPCRSATTYQVGEYYVCGSHLSVVIKAVLGGFHSVKVSLVKEEM